MSPSRPSDPGPLLGDSPSMAGVRDFLERAAAVGVPVLLVGESGTGKSHFARLLHGRGPRRDGPFVSINCAGVPDGLFEAEFFGHRRGAFTGASESRAGLFEQASGGTLFLDEVGELPLHQQAKLLAVLEEGRVRRVGGIRTREVDVRVVAATCRDLASAVASGEFRTDLYHRLALLRCEIPPLRARPADLDVMIDHLLVAAGERHGVAEPKLETAARELLLRHTWPGNVREMAHLLEAAVILAPGEVLGRELLANVMSGGPNASMDGGAPVGGADGVHGPTGAGGAPGAGRAVEGGGRPKAAGAPGVPGAADADGARGRRGLRGFSGAGRSTAPRTDAGPVEPAPVGGGPPAPVGGGPPAPRTHGATPRSTGRPRRYSFYGPPEEEREMIRRALARHRGNRTRAARELGMSRNTLRQRMRKYGI